MMSLAAESPVHSSSSSEDFAALLDSELELAFSASAPKNGAEEGGNDEEGGADHEEDEEEEDDVVEEEERNCRIKRHKMDDTVPPPGLTSDKVRIDDSPSPQSSGMCPPHPAALNGLCVACGRLVEDDGSGVAIGYIHKGLKVYATEADRIREVDLKNLLRKKKLILLLDLDHTLLNSTRLVDVSSDEEYLLRDAHMIQGDPKRSLFKLESMHLLTKLRPYVHTFLSEASSMYDMHIYTMAERSYALEIAKILDPEGVYFHSKVISQSDCTRRHQKGLDVVLGAESTVLILDDTETVWQRHRENLIVMERYHYFASSCHQFNSNQQALAVANKDERETDGILSSILNVLKRVHHMFFDLVLDADLSSRDVRLVLKKVRQEILQGCVVAFSRLFPSESRAEDQRIWKTCEQLGATCRTEVGSSVTHVVSSDKGTQKARWAAQNEKFLVNPGWVEAAFYLWRRMPEEDYPISNPKNQ